MPDTGPLPVQVRAVSASRPPPRGGGAAEQTGGCLLTGRTTPQSAPPTAPLQGSQGQIPPSHSRVVSRQGVAPPGRFRRRYAPPPDRWGQQRHTRSSSSMGRAPAFHAGGCGFETRLLLQLRSPGHSFTTSWQPGKTGNANQHNEHRPARGGRYTSCPHAPEACSGGNSQAAPGTAQRRG